MFESFMMVAEMFEKIVIFGLVGSYRNVFLK